MPGLWVTRHLEQDKFIPKQVAVFFAHLGKKKHGELKITRAKMPDRLSATIFSRLTICNHGPRTMIVLCQPFLTSGFCEARMCLDNSGRITSG